jgi:exopolysaccharide biosynthesis protein
MAKRTNALIAVNGGRFIDPTNKSNGNNPAGVTIQKHKIITDHPIENGMGVIGFNNDNILVLYKNKNAQELLNLGVRDCVTSIPFLIVNGVASFTKGNGGYGYAARTAIGQRKDGVTLILVVDSNETRTNGASMKDLTDIMLNYGAINAAALDGGTSTVMVEKGITISRPINASLRNVTRPVATGLVVNPEKLN